MYSVYKHTSPSGKVYIGITKQKPVKRWLHIVEVCKGKRNKAYGHKWAYYKGGDVNVSQSEQR